MPITLRPDAIGMIDLSAYSPEELADGIPAGGIPAGRWLPSAVEVAGFRSLAKAAWVVARLAALRARTRLRRAWSRTAG
jgi:hypothetical protein